MVAAVEFQLDLIDNRLPMFAAVNAEGLGEAQSLGQFRTEQCRIVPRQFT